MQPSPIIFSGNANRPLAEKIAQYLKIPLGDSTIQYFSDGEIWVKYNENIRGSDVFIIQPTNAASRNLLELLIMLDAAKRASAERITAVISYFGYARQDRKDQPRVAISAKLIANLLSTAGADRILTMDLHAPQIQGFFDIPVDHLYSSAIFTEYFREMKIPNLTVVSPDIGGITLARAYAKRLDAPLAIIDKRRPKHNEAEIMHIIGQVDGRNILIIDDIVDTAGTLCNAAGALKDHGAEDIYVACTHPILSGPAIERISEAPITQISVADTVFVPKEKQLEKIKILTASELFGEAIKRIHGEESISSLFD
ncbi:ribose-phosphate pyrophosphokinase [candidate division KSB1 bacterium]|nr:ribose-phosphate pyrophosphokinase [candidate division KSB1 bacterium]NIR69913.1 ribose-phosphate pyrophosphokinase [candidate division KSB1 bacterium]NIS25822.1 ribose-phosphate pyrophosphokinase [candidate division KSB1 bacterium]NIT72697.1 ribose-phosphate pyrophosphokinase [candidate division KSB1 bacterium]NIU26511.1 ribose-phosphate pyrophosphokinase [candidate division KSB1 bacterium]